MHSAGFTEVTLVVTVKFVGRELRPQKGGINMEQWGFKRNTSQVVVKEMH